MVEIIKRHFLKESDVKHLVAEFYNEFKVNLADLVKGKLRVEMIKTQRAVIYALNKKPLLMRIGGRLIPTLLSGEISLFLPKVAVDMRAVSHICNGADVMAPGITQVDGDFKKDDLVLVVDEKYRKPLAVGDALISSEEMKETKRGKTVKNLHYIGDKVWILIKKLT